MSLFRTGLLLATLLLSACSMPIIDNLSSSKDTSEKESVQEPITSNTDDLIIPNTGNQTEDTAEVIEEKAHVADDAFQDTLVQYNEQKKLAEANYEELKNRTGKADNLPKFLVNNETSKKNLDSAIQQLRSYTSKTNTDIAKLNARVADRQKVAINGDLIRIFLPEAVVTYKEKTFHAQPLVGQWVRGETRVIRLKDNILFENPKSEDLTITFSETYQLVVNKKVIATVNPKREKNTASFNVLTQDSSGDIVGKLDYRIENNK